MPAWLQVDVSMVDEPQLLSFKGTYKLAAEPRGTARSAALAAAETVLVRACLLNHLPFTCSMAMSSVTMLSSALLYLTLANLSSPLSSLGITFARPVAWYHILRCSGVNPCYTACQHVVCVDIWCVHGRVYHAAQPSKCAAARCRPQLTPA